MDIRSKTLSKKRFLYNGYLQIAELDAMNASETVAPVLRKTYLWDPMEPIATRVLAMNVFDETGAYVEDLFHTHDALKNTTALFGIQAGRRALYEYGPYGSTVKMEGNAAEVNPFRFSCEFFDEETGLLQYNFRYYNPLDGRWISRDPSIHTYNLYLFIKNKSSLSYDILGLKWQDPWWGHNDTNFKRWVHRQVKDIKDIEKPEMDDLYEEWKRKGKPNGENKKPDSGTCRKGCPKQTDSEDDYDDDDDDDFPSGGQSNRRTFSRPCTLFAEAQSDGKRNIRTCWSGLSFSGDSNSWRNYC